MTSILHISEQAIPDLSLDLSGTRIRAFPLLWFFGGVGLVAGLSWGFVTWSQKNPGKI